MDVKVKKVRFIEREKQSEEEMMGIIRKGPWSVQEDTILANYVATHGEGCWDSVARCAGLKRSGKSCRLRWLNYLRPDVRRGNITLQEQIMILDLHSRWGNRWSKIAKHLPGRTDNEIKNYWRTRVIKQAKQLRCDVNSKQFRDTLRYVWMPGLLEKIHPPSESYYPTHISHLKLDPGPSASASAAQLQVHSDSGYSVSSEHLGHDVSVHSVGNEPGLSPSFNNEMFEQGNNTILPLVGNGDLMESMWNDESIWVLRQFCDDIEMK